MRAKSLIISAGTSMLLVATSAFADPPAAPAPAPAAAKIDPKAKGSNPYNPKLQKGIAAYTSKDYQGAVAAYKERSPPTPTTPSRSTSSAKPSSQRAAWPKPTRATPRA